MKSKYGYWCCSDASNWCVACVVVRAYPDSSHSLGQRWDFVDIIVGPMLKNDADPCHFAHWHNLVVNGLFNFGPSPKA